jgi:acyl carrier protein
MDVKTRIRQYIVDSILMTGDGHDLSDQASLIERNILDSTGVLELASFLEDSFGIKIADEELVPANLDSVAAIASYVDRKRRAGDGLRATGYGLQPGPEPEPAIGLVSDPAA